SRCMSRRTWSATSWANSPRRDCSVATAASWWPTRRQRPEMRGYAIQRSVRQPPRKMRLVIDLIRGKNVNDAYAILQFNKKLAARQIAKTLKSAVANAEQAAERENEAFDVDQLVVVDAQVDMGTPLKRFTDRKSTRLNSSHVKISYAVFC